MLHKWQLVHSGGLNIFGLDKGVYNLTSIKTSETGYFFLIFLVSKFWPIFFLNSKFSHTYTRKTNFSQFLCQKKVTFHQKNNTGETIML